MIIKPTLWLLDYKPFPCWSLKQFVFAICAVWPGSILLADKLQSLMLITLNVIMNCSKTGIRTCPFMEFNRVRVNSWVKKKRWKCYLYEFSYVFLNQIWPWTFFCRTDIYVQVQNASSCDTWDDRNGRNALDRCHIQSHVSCRGHVLYDVLDGLHPWNNHRKHCLIID